MIRTVEDLEEYEERYEEENLSPFRLLSELDLLHNENFPDVQSLNRRFCRNESTEDTLRERGTVRDSRVTDGTISKKRAEDLEAPADNMGQHGPCDVPE